jgi:hypothetical protein
MFADAASHCELASVEPMETLPLSISYHVHALVKMCTLRSVSVGLCMQVLF